MKIPEIIWEMEELPPILVGDALAFKAQGAFQEWAVGLQGALSWHWAVAGMWLPEDEFGPADREIIGSINKGIAQELFSVYQTRHMRIYRPTLPKDEQERLAMPLLKRCAGYGAWEYDWLGVNEAAVVFILREIGLKLRLPANHRFYCIEFVNRLWHDFGLPLYNEEGPVTPRDLEQSDRLELIWGTY